MNKIFPLKKRKDKILSELMWILAWETNQFISIVLINFFATKLTTTVRGSYATIFYLHSKVFVAPVSSITKILDRIEIDSIDINVFNVNDSSEWKKRKEKKTMKKKERQATVW